MILVVPTIAGMCQLLLGVVDSQVLTECDLYLTV
jgi:hypothetical protein